MEQAPGTNPWAKYCSTTVSNDQNKTSSKRKKDYKLRRLFDKLHDSISDKDKHSSSNIPTLSISEPVLTKKSLRQGRTSGSHTRVRTDKKIEASKPESGNIQVLEKLDGSDNNISVTEQILSTVEGEGTEIPKSREARRAALATLLRARIEGMVTETREWETELAEIEARIAAREAEEMRIDDEISEVQGNISECDSQLSQLAQEILELDKQIVSVQIETLQELSDHAKAQ